jgi:siroheme synthase
VRALSRKALVEAGRDPSTPVVPVEQASLSGRQVLPATLATLGAAAAALGGGPDGRCARLSREGRTGRRQ